MEVSVQNKFLNLEARIKAENEVRMQEKSSPESPAELPFVRQGSGRRPGPLPLQPNGTPTRSRKNLDLTGISHSHRKSHSHGNKEKSEVEAKLQEIMKLTGIITINGNEYHSSIHDLEHLGELGYGSCGHVVKMLHPPSNTVIAIKQMRRSGNREENKRITMDLEVVLKSHDCPYIVQCLGCFVTEADVWICMELMATCFDKLLKRLRQAIPEPILGKVAVATVRALHYLKEVHGVIHRDVKPSNILLDERGNIKLCDFGISGWLEDSKAKTRSAGCAAYMAPERIEPPDPTHPDYDIRADVWSLGITLVELATGQFPYKDCQTDFEVLARVVRDDAPFITSSQGFSPEFCSFIKDCLTKNYKHRPKYKKLLEHPFIKKYQDSPVDVALWYAQVTRQVEVFARNSPQRKYTPPSPSLRRVTSEPPPVPPRTPESQRKPLLARLASEPSVEGLLDLHGGKQTYVNNKGEPLMLGDSAKNGKEKTISSLPPWVRSNSRENGDKTEPLRYPTTASPALPPKPSSSSRPGITSSQGRFILPVPSTGLPTLPPRPPVTPSTPEAGNGVESRGHFRQPPSDLPGLPPRPLQSTSSDSSARSPVDVNINGNVARFTQLFNAQAAQSSPSRSSPTQPCGGNRADSYESFTPHHSQAAMGNNGKQHRTVPSIINVGPPTSPRISPESVQSPRPYITEMGFSRLLSRTLPDPQAISSACASAIGTSPNGQLFVRRISAEGIPGRRFSPSPPQPPARNRLSSAGSSSVPASPVLQPRHSREHSEGSNLPRYFTPEPQRRAYGKMEL